MHSLLATVLTTALILNPEVFVFYCIVMNSLSFYSYRAVVLMCNTSLSRTWSIFTAHHMHINNYPCSSFSLVLALGDRETKDT